jgi:hypothetical protein
MADRIGYNGSDKWKIKATELLNEGSSEVIPNPQGEATDVLNTVEIDGDIYSIVGGGGSGGAVKILDNTERSAIETPFTLSDSMSNYDFIVFELYYSSSTYANQWVGNGIYKASDMVANAVMWITGGNIDRSVQLQIVDSTHYKIKQTRLDTRIKGVYGIKLNAGGGGGGDTEIIVHTTAEWQNLTSLVSKKGGIYIWSDYKTENGIDIPAIKIGDGLAYVVDLPFATQAITLSQIQSWNNKVSARISGENLILEN